LDTTDISSLSKLKSIYVNFDGSHSLNYSSIFDSLVIIRLANEPDALLRRIRKIKVHEGKIFVLNNDQLNVFDERNGKFIGIIGREGYGPGEYLTITDFTIHPDNHHIYLYDSKGMKTLEYTFTGEYMNHCNIGLQGLSIVCIPDKQNSFLYYTGYTDYNDSTNSMLNYVVDCKVKNRYFNIPSDMSKYFYFYDENNFTRIEDTIRYMHAPSDTIYSFLNKKIVPTYLIDFNKYKLPDDFLRKNYTDIVDFMEKLRKTNYASLLTGYLENNNYIFFQFEKNGSYYHFYYDKKLEKGYLVSFYNRDILFNIGNIEVSFFNRPVFFSDQYAYYVLEPFEVKDYLNDVRKNQGEKMFTELTRNNDNFQKLIQVGLENNPVILKYHFRENEK